MENRYCLQMVSCGDGCGSGNSGTGAKNVYSTEETVCGKWIDGKTIYRKVITGTVAEESGNSISFADASGLNIDRVINLYGNMIKKPKVHVMLQTSYSHTDGLYEAMNAAYNDTSKSIDYHLIDKGGYYSGCTAYVIIEYTKK